MANPIKRMVVSSASFAMRQSWLKGVVMTFLERSPGLRYQLRLFVHTGKFSRPIKLNTEALSPHAAKILDDLQQAIKYR